MGSMPWCKPVVSHLQKHGVAPGPGPAPVLVLATDLDPAPVSALTMPQPLTLTLPLALTPVLPKGGFLNWAALKQGNPKRGSKYGQGFQGGVEQAGQTLQPQKETPVKMQVIAGQPQGPGECSGCVCGGCVIQCCSPSKT